MTHCTRGLRAFQSVMWVRLAAVLLAVFLGGGEAAANESVEASVREVLVEVWGDDLGGGMRLVEARSWSHMVRLEIRSDAGGRPIRIQLQHPARPGHRVGSFSVALQTSFSQVRLERDRRALAAIERVLDEIARRDPGGLGEQLAPPHRHPWLEKGAYRWLPAAALALLILGWTRRDRLQWVIRPNHAIPAMIQVTLYGYWFLYTASVGPRFFDIAGQLVFAYSFEALLRWSRGKTWHVTLGPLPVVFSTNLFVWFIEPWLQCLAIAIALGAKDRLLRDGRHIFNPSALGVSVLAFLALAVPSVFWWGTPTPDVELNLPPNMAELMLVLTVLAQLRFPIVLVPMTATFGIWGARWVGFSPPDPFWPATFLILLLFATDPKTLPRTTSGRVVYGLSLGVSLSLISAFLSAQNLPDTYAKVLPIPVLNYLAPQLDRMGEALYARWKGVWVAEHSELRTAVGNFLEPRFNRWHVGVWVVLAVMGISAQKPGSFQVLAHWELETPHVVAKSANGFPTCAENPVWCRPFSFGAEARLWLE